MPPRFSFEVTPNIVVDRVLHLRRDHGRPCGVLSDGSVITATVGAGPGTLRKLSDAGLVTARETLPAHSSFKRRVGRFGFVGWCWAYAVTPRFFSTASGLEPFHSFPLPGERFEVSPPDGAILRVSTGDEPAVDAVSARGEFLGPYLPVPVGLGLRGGPIASVAVSPDGALAVTLRYEETLVVRHPKSAPAFTVRRSPAGHTSRRRAPVAAFVPALDGFVFGFDDGVVAAWNPPPMSEGPCWRRLDEVPHVLVRLDRAVEAIAPTSLGFVAQDDRGLSFVDREGTLLGRLEVGVDLAHPMAWRAIEGAGILVPGPRPGAASLYDGRGRRVASWRFRPPSWDSGWVVGDHLVLVDEKGTGWDVAWLRLSPQEEAGPARRPPADFAFVSAPADHWQEPRGPIAPGPAPVSTQPDSPLPTAARLPSPPRVGRGDWWIVRGGGTGGLPFSFRSSHPRASGPIDFAIWCAFDRRAAERHFSTEILDAFEYSWRGLLALIGETPQWKTPRSFVAVEREVPPELNAEFRSWGGLLMSLYIGKYAAEPAVYKLVPPEQRPWAAQAAWTLADRRTPRVYRFEGVACNERCFLCLDEEADDPFEEVGASALPVPNLGIQFAEDGGLLMVLPRDWGFDEVGRLTFVSNGHSEFARQLMTLPEQGG